MNRASTADLQDRKRAIERQTGILLVGHGTRSERGVAEFLQIAGDVARQAAPMPVEPAYLELCQPTIRAGLARLIERGARHIAVAPLLLLAAGHARRDIPAALAAALEELRASGRVTISLAGHLGCHAGVVELSRRRYTESLLGRQFVPPGDTCLVLVGRGSPDESATAEMHEFARRRVAGTSLAETRIAFLAMAEPPVRDVLRELGAGNWRRIVVQPHLLLHGELYDSLVEDVGRQRRVLKGTELIVTSYLAGSLSRGPAAGDTSCELVTQVVLARVQSAGPVAAIRVVAP
jgi:sirohydrochlorin cobaltochelatase